MTSPARPEAGQYFRTASFQYHERTFTRPIFSWKGLVNITFFLNLKGSISKILKVHCLSLLTDSSLRTQGRQGCTLNWTSLLQPPSIPSTPRPGGPARPPGGSRPPPEGSPPGARPPGGLGPPPPGTSSSSTWPMSGECACLGEHR